MNDCCQKDLIDLIIFHVFIVTIKTKTGWMALRVMSAVSVSAVPAAEPFPGRRARCVCSSSRNVENTSPAD